jgi:hypothetical protein
MSYLRGPLTRQQVQVLMRDQRSQLLARVGAASYAPLPPPPVPVNAPGPTFASQSAFYAQQAAPVVPLPPTLPEAPPSLPEVPTASAPVVAVTPSTPAPAPPAPSQPARASTVGYSENPPPLPASTDQYFLPATINGQQALAAWQQRTGFSTQNLGVPTMSYKPVLLAQASIRFQDRKTQLFVARLYSYRVHDLERSGLVHWEDYVSNPVDPRQVTTEPLVPGLYGELSPGLTDAKRLAALKKELSDLLYTTARLKIPYNSTLDIFANPDGDFSEFRAQVQQMARERRDADVDKLTRKYEGILNKYEANLQRKTTQLASENAELQSTKREELFTTGEAVLGLLNGRTAFTLSRMSRAKVYAARSKGQKDLLELDIQQGQAGMQSAQEDFEMELRAINEKWAQVATSVEERVVTPARKDITMDLFGIGWLPYWYLEFNGQPALLPAFE